MPEGAAGHGKRDRLGPGPRLPGAHRHGRPKLTASHIPAAGISAEELRDRLLKVRGVTYYISVGLPMPLAKMVRTWTRTHQHEDLGASLTALENALSRA